MSVAVTALYGAANAILNILLAANVSRWRGKVHVAIGTGESKELLQAARAHGNNAEFVPLGLVMLLVAELSGGSSVALHVLGGSLLIGRIFHVIGLPMKAPNVFRATGVGLTWIMIVAASVYSLMLRGHPG